MTRVDPWGNDPDRTTRRETPTAMTLRGNVVEIIDWSTDSYLVRFVDGGAVKWMPRELLRPAS